MIQVGCSLLYFIVALLDKWNSLLAGGKLLGLSAQNTKYRMPVGFALAYYLIGAVLLDLNAAKLHTMTAQSQNMLIGDVSSIPDAVNAGVKARRNLYWRMLGRYSLFHVWSLAVSSTLLWVFNSSEASTLLFVAYVGAYTGKENTPTIRIHLLINLSKVCFSIRYALFRSTLHHLHHSS